MCSHLDSRIMRVRERERERERERKKEREREREREREKEKEERRKRGEGEKEKERGDEYSYHIVCGCIIVVSESSLLSCDLSSWLPLSHFIKSVTGNENNIKKK